MIELMNDLKQTARERLKHAKRFTETYRLYAEEHIAIREAMCQREQFPDALLPIMAGDRFAGRYEYGLVGFTPQSWTNSFAYYCDFKGLEQALREAEATGEEQAEYEALAEFWRSADSAARTRAAYPKEMAEAFPSDDWQNESGIAFPLYRMAGVCLDFDKLLRLGIPGLRVEVEEARQQAIRSGGDVRLFEGMLMALTGMSQILAHYGEQALWMSRTSSEDQAAAGDLKEMARVLFKISEAKPDTLREAIQLMWVYTLVANVRNYGRMDIYLGDFLAGDLADGIITEAEALSLVQSLWRLMAARELVYDGRVILGGRGRRNVENADRFALIAIEATRTVKGIEPQLSLRFYTGMNPLLYKKALDCIGEGRTYPILYNDDVNIEAFSQAYGVSLEEAEQVLPYGCGEFVLDHRGVGTPSGVINLAKALEVVLHGGFDPMKDPEVAHRAASQDLFGTFEELFAAYKRQVDDYVRHLADQEELEYRVAGELAPFHYLSILHDDCLASGKPIFAGGVRYLSGTLETYGNTNAADSLTAIKRLVFEEKRLTLPRLVEALDRDFTGEGDQEIQRLLTEAPKYGNNIGEADEMLLAVHRHVCESVRNQRDRTGLFSYLVVNINNSANTILGRFTGASADGRRAGKPLANGNTPSGGSDKRGATALLNSLVKPDASIHAGMTQNLKFSRDLFRGSRSKLVALLDAYFAKGGTQAMITVVNRDDLERAMAEPHLYKDLFVRVGGFSARFIELPRDVQLDIISRTLY